MKKALLAAGLVGITACAETTSPSNTRSDITPRKTITASTTTVVVSQANLNGACQTLEAPVYCYTEFPTGWLFYNDLADQGNPTLGSFVAGPGAPTYGSGSAQISVVGTQRSSLATYAFAGTLLADITVMSFRTYNPSAGNGGAATRSAYLNFNVDFNGSDTWQRRLVFVPRQNGTVLQNTWQEWDAINAGAALWSLSGGNWPGTLVSGTTHKTWSQILSEYPGVRIRVTDAHLGLRVGEPYADGYTENIDSFTFGTAAGTTIYDFDPFFGACNVSVSGTTITLLSNCTTTQTLFIPDGFTLDGNGFSITAVEPATGTFTGAIVTNAGPVAHVNDLTVTASSLTNACGALTGIRFYGATGSILDNTVTNINRGPNGCQDGNGIDIRNDLESVPYVPVTVSGNVVSAYNKNGITANGRVKVTILNNIVTGLGPVGEPLAAQNGIQVSRGATGTVKGNTVRDNNYLPASWLACGILFYQASGVKASGNTFFGNEKDICNAGKGGGNIKASN